MGFMDGCRFLGLTLETAFLQEEYISTEGRNPCCKAFSGAGEGLAHRCFCSNQRYGCGGCENLPAVWDSHPEDMEVLSFGGVMEAYTEPAVSSISMPVEEMSAECLRMVSEAVHNGDRRPLTRVMPLTMNFRKTCGGFPKSEPICGIILFCVFSVLENRN